jgi:hypothetical protein
LPHTVTHPDMDGEASERDNEGRRAGRTISPRRTGSCGRRPISRSA